MLETLTHESFEPHVGTEFTVSVGEYDDVFTLTEVSARKPIPGFERVPFALIFQGTRTDLFFNSQALEFRHPVMGTIAMMMSPLGPDQTGAYRYEVVFS